MPESQGWQCLGFESANAKVNKRINAKIFMVVLENIICLIYVMIYDAAEEFKHVL